MLLSTQRDLQVMLAIEDGALARTVRDLLARADGEALPALAPIALVEVATGAEPDVILVEVGGPGGVEPFRELRDRYPTTPLLTLSREADAELAELTRQYGADDLLYASELQGTLLHRALSHARERHRLLRQLVAAREREAQLSTHDSVTGLANRALFYTCVTQAIAFAERQGRGLAVACLEFQGLPSVNRRFGFEAGDRLLETIGERLQDSIRTSDMVGRLGGGEFLVLLRDVDARIGAAQAIETMFAEVARPIYAAGHKVAVKMHAGVAPWPADGEDVDALVSSAHHALQIARERGCSYAFSPARDDEAQSAS